METNLFWKRESGPAILKLYSSHGSARELSIISTKRGCHGVRHTCLHRSQKILWHYGFSCIFLEDLSSEHLHSSLPLHCRISYYSITKLWTYTSFKLHLMIVFSTDALHCSNISTTQIGQWWFRQCFLSAGQHRKHCWYPIIVMGVVDTFGHTLV